MFHRLLAVVLCVFKAKIQQKETKITQKDKNTLLIGRLIMAHISENGVKKICEICDRYANEKTPLMMILSDIQNEYGYIPLEVQQIVSEKTGISVADIYGVVTFYSFFSLEPKGKYVIGCCLGTACYVKGAQQIIDKFSEILGVKPGETTADGLFTIDALRCIGACGIAPAVTINGKVYPKMTVDAVAGVVNEYLAKEGK
jgi:NADH:ubiquinone oxidoreductase subunit E